MSAVIAAIQKIARRLGYDHLEIDPPGKRWIGGCAFFRRRSLHSSAARFLRKVLTPAHDRLVTHW
jgi:hypothetical protein